MTQFEDIRYEVEDGVATVRLHRPDHLNAFSGKMGRELGEALRGCDLDDSVRVVILTGSGHAFCAGAGDNPEFETLLKKIIDCITHSRHQRECRAR